MNVAIVVPDPALGPDVPYGDSARLRLLSGAIESLGHQVEMLWAESLHQGSLAPARRPPVPGAIRPLLRDVRTLVQARRYHHKIAPGIRPDLVLEFASYLAPVGLRVARHFDVPYVVEVEGPLRDLRYELGRSPLRPLGDLWLRQQLREAASVLTVSRPLADHVIGLGATESRVIVAPNVADATLFASSDAVRSRVRANLGIAPETFVVGFHGVFSPWYALPTLVGAVSNQTLQPVCVLLVGDGVDRLAVEAAAHASGARVIITGFVPQKGAAELIQAADVGVVPDHAWWTSPLKLFEFGALRKPVIAARVPSITAVASETEVAMFDPTSPNGLAELLRELANDTSRRAHLADAWHARVLRDYTLPALRANVAESLDRAVS